MLELLNRGLPDVVRTQLKRSATLRRLRERHSARQLASSSKRLDLCAAQVAHVLHLARAQSRSVELRDRVCVELGAGWVLTHSLVLHLLGAKRVIATDLEALADPSTLALAIRGSTLSVVRDVLSAFDDHDRIRARLAKLAAISSFSFDTLRSLGIEYVAPVDLAKRAVGEPFDFVYSNSVLEHVPTADIPRLLGHLAHDLRAGGAMIHSIHLEDHRDIANDPFAFFSEPAARYGADEQSRRGNRVRASEWLTLAEAAGLSVTPLYRWKRLDRPTPSVDASIAHLDRDDLVTSHVGLLCQKPQ